MGAKKFKLEFTSQPEPIIDDNSYRAFGLKVAYDNELIFSTLKWFKFTGTPGSGAVFILVGESLTQTVANTAAAIQYDIDLLNIDSASVSIVGNTVEIIFGNNTVDVQGVWVSNTHVEAAGWTFDWGVASIEEYTFEESGPITLPDAIVLSRSPYWFRHTPGVTFDRMVINLYIYRGNKTTDVPASATYSLSKFVTQAGQSTIGFDIQALLNDYVQNSLYEIGQDGYFESNTNDSIFGVLSKVRYISATTLCRILNSNFWQLMALAITPN